MLELSQILYQFFYRRNSYWVLVHSNRQFTGEGRNNTDFQPWVKTGFQSSSTLMLCLSPWKLHLYLCSALPLNSCQVYFIFFPYKLIILILLFYAQITCVVSVSSPDPDQYSRLPSKAEPKAKSLSGSCLWGNVILESRTGRPGNNWRKDQVSGESHSWSHQWAGRFQSWNILWSYMKHVKTNTERGMKLGFLYTLRQVQSEGMSDSLSLNMVELFTEPVTVAVAGIKGEAK